MQKEKGNKGGGGGGGEKYYEQKARKIENEKEREIIFDRNEK